MPQRGRPRAPVQRNVAAVAQDAFELRGQHAQAFVLSAVEDSSTGELRPHAFRGHVVGRDSAARHESPVADLEHARKSRGGLAIDDVTVVDQGEKVRSTVAAVRLDQRPLDVARDALRIPAARFGGFALRLGRRRCYEQFSRQIEHAPPRCARARGELGMSFQDLLPARGEHTFVRREQRRNAHRS
jgi:hypothetical protein